MKMTTSDAEFDFMNPKVMWWSWDEAHKRAASCGCRLSLGWMQIRGYKGAFLCGAAAGAPDRFHPVRRDSFEQWLAGGDKINAVAHQKRKYTKSEEQVPQVG